MNELTYSKQSTNQLTASKCLLLPKHIVTDSSNRINCTRTIDVSETNLKCLSVFCLFFYFDDKNMTTNKKSTSTKEYAIKYFFNTFIVTDEVILQTSV